MVPIGSSSISIGAMILIVVSQGRRGSNLFLAIRLVVQNHVTGRTPETRANGSESHIWWTQLRVIHISKETFTKSEVTYDLLTVELKVLLCWHDAILRILRARGIDALSHVG